MFYDAQKHVFMCTNGCETLDWGWTVSVLNMTLLWHECKHTVERQEELMWEESIKSQPPSPPANRLWDRGGSHFTLIVHRLFSLTHSTHSAGGCKYILIKASWGVGFTPLTPQWGRERERENGRESEWERTKETETESSNLIVSETHTIFISSHSGFIV